jgi:Ca2+-binding RTX toxin-like protein
MLAGDVTVSVVAGDLIITGDALSNAIVLEATANAGEFVISDAADVDVGATTLNGGGTPLTLAGVTGSIVVTMGDGDDRVTVSTARDIAIADDLSIGMGLGNDRLTSSSTRRIGVGGDLNITTAEGDDVISLAQVRVGGNSTIDTGVGDDRVTLHNTSLSSDRLNYTAGNLSLVAGDGNDFFTLDGTFTVGQNITFDGGFGNDILNAPKMIRYVSAVGNITLQFGDGSDTLVGKGLFASGDALVDFGAGNDVCIFANVFVRNLTTNLGAGVDSLGGGGGAADNLVIRGNLSLDCGSESDYVALGTTQVSGGMTVVSGEGADGLWLNYTSVIGSLSVDGGDGHDYILVERFGVGASATLRGGSGHDKLIANIGRAASLSIESAAGYDVVDARWLRITSQLTVDSGSESDLVNVIGTVARTLSLNTAAGSDVAKIEHSAFETLFAQLGDDHDALELAGSMTHGTAVVDGGAGFDLLTQRGNLFGALDVRNVEAIVG